MKRNILRTTQSPMNAQRWVLDLDCGHEVWITRRGKPKAKTAECDKCVPLPDPPGVQLASSAEEGK